MIAIFKFLVKIDRYKFQLKTFSTDVSIHTTSSAVSFVQGYANEVKWTIDEAENEIKGQKDDDEEEEEDDD